MEVDETVAMFRRSRFFLLALSIALLFSTLSGCGGSVPVVPTVMGPTVTPNPFAPSTATPFLPAADTPFASPVSSATSTTSPVPSNTPAFMPSPTVSPPPTITLAPSTPASPTERPQYTLNARLDYANRSLAVDESITYTNQTGGSLSSLVLAVQSDLWMNCFVLGSLAVNGQPSNGYMLSGIRLEVPLATPLASGGTDILALHYDLFLPTVSSAQIFGYNGSQINVTNWYPFVVPYDPAQGWLLHEPTDVGENLVYDAADFDVTIRMADDTLSVVVAVSAPAEQVDQGWHYRLQNARTFVFSASPSYVSSSTTVGPVTITSYYFGSHSVAGKAVLQQVATAVATYSDRYAPDPYSSLSIVEAVFPDGMEYDGLFFLSRDFYAGYDGTVQNNLTAIGVHETAHQWWFGLVADDQALEPWLDEALSTYSERIFYETNYPGLVNWWWGFRVNAYSPIGWVDADIYNGGNFRSYTNAVYLRGALFLEALRNRIGSEAFFAFLKDYTAQMAHKRTTASDFFRILRQHTSVDISDLVSAYFQYSQ